MRVDYSCSTPQLLCLHIRGLFCHQDWTCSSNVVSDMVSTTEIIEICFQTKFRSFITTPGDNNHWMNGNFSIQAVTVRLLREAGLSDALLSNIYADTSYWAKMGDHQISHYDEKKTLKRFGIVLSQQVESFPTNVLPEMCYQYRYGWDTGISFTHMVRTPSRITYFCINYPEEALLRLRSYFEEAVQPPYPDFLVDVLAADVSSKKWLVEINKARTEMKQRASLGYKFHDETS